MEDDKQKQCVVCSMPLKNQEDYSEGCDMNTCNHCKHCGNKEGLYAYDDLVKGMAGFMAKTQDMPEEEAKKAAKEMLANCEAVKMGMLDSDDDDDDDDEQENEGDNKKVAE